jgi:hypothetical protein
MSTYSKKSSSTKFAYHYTDTIRLPWIIESGELRPGTNRIGGFPRDFLWATTNESGDRTSSAMSPAGLRLWRDGASQLVRLTLNAIDFASFPEITKSCPEWTADHAARLIKAAAAMGEKDTSKWLSRSEPLSLARVVRVEAKSFALGRWVEIDATYGRCIASDKYPNTRGVIIGEHWYAATRVLTSDGSNVAYEGIRRHPLSLAA